MTLTARFYGADGLPAAPADRFVLARQAAAFESLLSGFPGIHAEAYALPPKPPPAAAPRQRVFRERAEVRFAVEFRAVEAEGGAAGDAGDYSGGGDGGGDSDIRKVFRSGAALMPFWVHTNTTT